MNLTPKQFDIVKFIEDYRKERGYSPTLAEIGEELGISAVTVFEHIEALEKKGAVTRQRGRARGIAISRALKAEVPTSTNRPYPYGSWVARAVRRPSVAGLSSLSLPLVGYIAAGSPIEAVEDRDALNLAEIFSPDKECFVLRVKGDSMVDEGIHDGDFVIVEKKDTAQNGETVVALLPDNEATLKKFYREKDHIRLQPANPQSDPIHTKDVRIQGVVIGVLRKY
jgi:repressor LexA